MALIQNQLEGSWYARFMVEHSLFLSSHFDNLWVTKLLDKVKPGRCLTGFGLFMYRR